MALTISQIRRTVWGDHRAVTATVTFDASYPTGGESLTAANLGLVGIEAVIPAGPARSATPEALPVSFDLTNSKLLAFRVDQVDDILEQVPDTTDLSAFSVVLLVLGL